MSNIKDLYIDIEQDLVNGHNKMVKAGELGTSLIYENVSKISPVNAGNFDIIKPYHVIEQRHVNSLDDFELIDWLEYNNPQLVENVINKYVQ